MDILTNPLYKALFNTPVPRLLLLANPPHFTILASNDAHEAASNLLGKNIVGKTPWQIYDPLDTGNHGWLVLLDALVKASETNQRVYIKNYKYDILPSTNNVAASTLWDLEVLPILGNNGEMAYLMATTNNLSERLEREEKMELQIKKKAKADLKEINQRLQFALEAGKLGSFDLDFNTGKIISNEQFKRNYGKPVDAQFHYNDLLESVVPSYKQYLLERIKQAAETNTTCQAEYQIIWPDGSAHWVSIAGKPYFDSNGKMVRMVGVSQDITKQVADKYELLRATETLNQAIDSGGLGLWSADLRTDVLNISPKAKSQHGLKQDEEVTLSESFEMIDSNDREFVSKAFAKALEESSNFDIEYLIHPKDGSNPRWLRSTGRSYEDEFGNLSMVSGTIMDITDQKEEEVRKGQFIGMVGHELKTPLTSLKAYMQLSASYLKYGHYDLIVTTLEKANRQINKMTKLINSFLSVSRLESSLIILDQHPFDFALLVKEIMEEIEVLAIGHPIKLIKGDSVTVHADREKIGQVIFNYISNASKYSTNGTPIHISYEVSDGHLQFGVTDGGIGIKAHHLDKIFGRYYQVNSNPSLKIAGFGISLYLCYKIINRHGGHVWAESQYTKGSSFYFSLPLSL